jgi:hypothetical protein
MTPSTRDQFFSNEAIIKAAGYKPDNDRTRADDGDAPELICPSCGESVLDYEYIDEMKMCRECYKDEYGSSWVSPDQLTRQGE